MREQAGKNRGTSLAILLVIVIPLLYILSIGPVIAIAEKTNAPKEPFQIIYAPVIWLAQNTFLAEPLQKYAELWGWH